MMKSLLIVVSLVSLCMIGAFPVFPPLASEYQFNITYSPCFMYPDHPEVAYKGIYRVKGLKKVVIGEDLVRTAEVAIYRADTHKTLIASQFGEFGWSCNKGAETKFSFIPFIGFDGDWFAKNAKLTGRWVQCSEDGTLCDNYAVEAPEFKKSAIVSFNSKTQEIFKIVETDKSEETVERTAFFADFKQVPQNDAFFEPPAKARC